jgi:hypothetical protein
MQFNVSVFCELKRLLQKPEVVAIEYLLDPLGGNRRLMAVLFPCLIPKYFYAYEIFDNISISNLIHNIARLLWKSPLLTQSLLTFVIELISFIELNRQIVFIS